MDWGMKLPSWDPPELEHVSEPNNCSVVAAVTSSSGSLRLPSTGLDFDLKLGGLGDFGSSSRLKEQPRASTTPVVSPPAPFKRARTPSNGSQSVLCLVDGCKSDLSNCREYHRRHKVCEVHSKTPIVLVGGQEQRFCQQCSRFHSLVEFDEVKRSCRKRLDGHNRRRRKPQPEPMNSGSLPLNLQGPRFSSYSHLYPTSTADLTGSSTIVKNEDTLFRLYPPHLAERHLNFSSSYSCSYGEGKQRFPFQQDNAATISSGTPEATSVCQPLLNTISFSVNNGNGGKMFASGSPQVLDSDCALSLLSSPTQVSNINQSHMVTFDRIPVAQPSADGLQLQQYGSLGKCSRPQSSNDVSTPSFSCSGMDDRQQQASTVLVSHDTDVDLQCEGIFHVGGGSSSNGPSIVLPFSW